MNFNDYLNEKLEDPELKKEYDKLFSEYEIISKLIRAELQKEK